jgi:hypothetical protein
MMATHKTLREGFPEGRSVALAQGVTMKTKYLPLLLLLLAPACNKPAPPNATPQQQHNPVLDLPEAYAEKDGLVSLTFDVAKFIPPEQYGQGATHLTLEARHDYTTMRFDVTVGRHGEPFGSMGGTGDQFLRVLDELFGTNAKPRGMRPSTHFTHEVLEGDPTELNKGPAKLKLTHANGAQFLLLVDMKAKKVEIRESGKKYRRQIIQAFQN